MEHVLHMLWIDIYYFDISFFLVISVLVPCTIWTISICHFFYRYFGMQRRFSCDFICPPSLFLLSIMENVIPNVNIKRHAWASRQQLFIQIEQFECVYLCLFMLREMSTQMKIRCVCNFCLYRVKTMNWCLDERPFSLESYVEFAVFMLLMLIYLCIEFDSGT